ncbi:hypothetical protein DCS32_11920 [Dokdonia sp. Dokd-P16]|nr:hypothetical protein DCS32_11920 [Dokdonia sp. Dokd-P16]
MIYKESAHDDWFWKLNIFIFNEIRRSSLAIVIMDRGRCEVSNFRESIPIVIVYKRAIKSWIVVLILGINPYFVPLLWIQN